VHSVFLYTLDPGYVLGTLPELLSGLRLTIAVSAIGVLGALAVGIVGGGLRAAQVPVANQVANVYVEFIRNTPLLVQIFFLYFAMPQLNVTLSAFTVGWLSLVLWGGAYNIENFRAGFEAVAQGYREAASALGLSGLQAFRHVVLPIGVRISLPSLTNTCISVLKNSSYLVAISFPELTTTAVNIVSLSFRVFEMFITIAAIYLALVWSLSALMAALERRLALPGTR
jgi:polar amino acid transport system permease protein